MRPPIFFVTPMRSSGSRVGWKIFFVIFTKLIPRKIFFCIAKILVLMVLKFPICFPFWREFCWALQVCGASGVNTAFPYRVRIVDSVFGFFARICCDPSRHLQESPGPPGPKSQKSLKKGLLGGLQKSPKKYPKKSKNTDFRTFLGIFSPFRVFFGTFLQTPQKTFFETFSRFRARRARRLL